MKHLVVVASLVVVPSVSLAQEGTVSQTERNEALVMRFYEEVWHNDNYSIADEIFAPDYIRHDASDPVQGPGKAVLQSERAREVKRIIPDLRYDYDVVIAEGDMVAVRWTGRGNPAGVPAFMRRLVGKSGPVVTTGANIYRFRDGRVVELWNNRDDLTIQRETGVFRWYAVTAFLIGVLATMLCVWAVRRVRSARAGVERVGAHARVFQPLFWVLLVTFSTGAPASAQVLKLAELNTEQIRALDRDKTIILIPGGILEQHGPFLPSFTDGYRNERATEELARAVAARPGWTALVFPMIPLGVGGANAIGGQFSFPGTYGVRSSTLRAVFVDLASELGEQGFKWIFVIHLHGAPAHHRALDEAGEYFRDTYGGRMVNLYGFMPVIAAGAQSIDPAEAAQNGWDVHAGRTETSAILFLRPDLVAPGYRAARSLPGQNADDLVRIARSPGWPGYFGAPSQATAAEGKTRIRERSAVAADYMWRIVEGADERHIPRWDAAILRSEAVVRIDEAAAAHERALEERFSAWLSRRRDP